MPTTSLVATVSTLGECCKASMPTLSTQLTPRPLSPSVPLFNEPRVALLFAETLKARMPKGCLLPYEEGRIPSEIVSWKSVVPESA